MVAYPVNNTAGALIATIPVGTHNDTATPLDLVGMGFSLYGEKMAENLVKLCEHFANTTSPANAIPGTIWYDSTTSRKYLNFYNGSVWIPIAGGTSSASVLFPMLNSSVNIDFATAATTAIFTAPANSVTYHPTSVLLIPNGTPSATTPPAFSLRISSAEDVMDNAVISNYAANKHAYFEIEGSTRFATNGNTVSLEVTTAATGGTLAFDAYLFGFIRA